MNVTKQQIQDLERALDNMKNMHSSFWKEYGSELSVGDLLKKEKELEDEIKELKEEYESGKNN